MEQRVHGSRLYNWYRLFTERGVEELCMVNPEAVDSYSDSRNTKLISKEIDIDPDLENDSIEDELGFRIENLTL